jgi:endonuclease YncB( thermonuclease family)
MRLLCLPALVSMCLAIVGCDARAPDGSSLNNQSYSPHAQPGPGDNHSASATTSGRYYGGLAVSGEVTKVHDGDSTWLDVAGVGRFVVRLQGIDSPELAQDYGAEAGDSLRDRILGHRVDALCSGVDRYDRNICVIYRNGVDMNIEQIRLGSAWHYKAYQNEQTASDRIAYANAEITARQNRRGLWASGNAIAPWNYR